MNPSKSFYDVDMIFIISFFNASYSTCCVIFWDISPSSILSLANSSSLTFKYSLNKESLLNKLTFPNSLWASFTTLSIELLKDDWLGVNSNFFVVLTYSIYILNNGYLTNLNPNFFFDLIIFFFSSVNVRFSLTFLNKSIAKFRLHLEITKSCNLINLINFL